MSEETFARVLERHADDVRPFHLDLDGVRTSAHRIRRRRRVVATSAAALVAAVAVGVPSVLGSSGSRTVPEPAPPVPSVTVTPGQTVSYGLDAPTGELPAVPYLRLSEAELTTPDGTLSLPDATTQAVPYAGGWLARILNSGSRLARLDADGAEVEDLGTNEGPLQATPDGSRVAWIEAAGDGSTALVVHDAVDGRELQRSPLADAVSARVVGFTDGGVVYVLEDDDAEETEYVLDDQGRSTPLEGFIHVTDASPETDVVSGHVHYTDDYQVCSSVLRDGVPLWPERCGTQVRDLSPDGTRVLAGLGEPVPGFQRVAVLDVETGEPLVTFRGGRTASIAEMAWEDADHVLAVVVQGTRQAVLRLGVDGSVEQAVAPVEADPMSVTWLLAGRPFQE